MKAVMKRILLTIAAIMEDVQAIAFAAKQAILMMEKTTLKKEQLQDIIKEAAKALQIIAQTKKHLLNTQFGTEELCQSMWIAAGQE
ncbi:MAG: hypothetical protein ACPL07_01235, partial [Candidatus Bathyarchaeia archaeon]